MCQTTSTNDNVTSSPSTSTPAATSVPLAPSSSPLTTPVSTKEEGPTEVATYYEQGLQAYYASQWLVALDYFEQVYTKAGPDYREVKALLARSYYQHGLALVDSPTPIEQVNLNFKAALVLEPGFGEAQRASELARHYQAAQFLLGEQKWEEAALTLRELKQIQPNYRDSFQQLQLALELSLAQNQ